MAPNRKTQWRREDQARTLLEQDGFSVIRIGCRSSSVFDLIATNKKCVRFIRVHTDGQIPMREIRNTELPDPASIRIGSEAEPLFEVAITREIWKWDFLHRSPEIVVL